MSFQVKMILLADRRCPSHSLTEMKKMSGEGRRQGGGSRKTVVEIALVRSFTKGS